MHEHIATEAEAQAGAFGLVGERIANLMKFFKDALVIFGRDADASIRDARMDFIVDDPRRQGDRALVGES